MYSDNDLRDAAEFRASIHKEALVKIRKVYPDAQSVVDRYPVEAYLEDVWEYPGRWYTYAAVPKDAGSRDDLVDTIVKDTLEHLRKLRAAQTPKKNWNHTDSAVVFRSRRYTLCKQNGLYYLIADGKRLQLACSPYEPCLYITDENGSKTAVHNAFDPNTALGQFYKGGTVTSITGHEYDAADFCKMVEYADGMGSIGIDDAEKVFADRPEKKADAEMQRDETDACFAQSRCPDDPFYALIAAYPDCEVDYCIVTGDPLSYRGCESHWQALEAACRMLLTPDGWRYDVNRARGRRISAEDLFTSTYPKDKLNYRKAFLYPPHGNSYSGVDLVKVNAALFPNGTDKLEVYEWSTDWSDYFDEGHEWWGALCCTVYDKSLDRFAVLFASATD